MTKRPSVMSLDDLMPAKAEPPPAPEVVAPVPQAATPEAVPEGEPEEEAEEPQGKGKKPVPGTFRTSMYFDREVHDVLREIAFRERVNVSDLINEGLDHVLAKRRKPSVAELKAKGARKRKSVGTR